MSSVMSVRARRDCGLIVDVRMCSLSTKGITRTTRAQHRWLLADGEVSRSGMGWEQQELRVPYEVP